MARTIFYNAHHAPIGAFATLTLGAKGSSGGFGLELDRPAACSLYIGAESDTTGRFLALPLFGEGIGPQASDFDLEGGEEANGITLSAWPDEVISRRLTPCLDEWQAEDFTFRVISPIRSIPEPAKGNDDLLAEVILPLVWIELTLDNRKGSASRRMFFGQQGGEPSAGLAHAQSDSLTGIWLGRNMGFFTDEPEAVSGIAFGPSIVLDPNDPTDLTCMLGSCGMVTLEVPAGEVSSLRLVGAFYRDGAATTGIKTEYLYTKFHEGLEEAAVTGLGMFNQAVQISGQADIDFDRPELSEDQRFMLAHSLRSYYGSTQLLVTNDGSPLWNVNEGEYRMMNTFDLTVDHLFYELRMNPWVQKNALDLFVSRYSYYDEIAGQTAIAFTHDMGVGNQFSRPGWSSYERKNETGCFSHMSHEELVNWVLCACVTLEKSPDPEWKQGLQPVFADCLQSLCLRDNPDLDKRTGIMFIDSPRCGPNGVEITTYDSLDPSLGQSRSSTYLGVKTLAAYAHLANALLDHDLRNLAEGQALLSLSTLSSSFTEEGILPALLESADQKLIIPVIEGLVYFRQTRLWGEWIQMPEFAGFVEKLSRHLHLVLQPEKCLFPSGAWKLSASSSNSWLSKIYLCQHVARTCLGWKGLDCFAEADAAHVDWLLHPDSLYWAWSDQMVDGVAKGSKYYPRGVTAILWLDS
jgi:hypothetical protein